MPPDREPPDAAALPATSWLGVTTLVLTLLGWSSVPLFLRYFAHQGIDAWTSNGWRYGFSALIWAPAIVLAAIGRRTPRGLWAAAVIPSFFNAAGQITFTLAHYQIDPGLLTFGLRLQIVFVTVGAALLFPVERRVIRSPLFLFGLVVVFGGTLGTVLMSPGFGEKATTYGVVLAISSGLLFACYALAVRKFMHGTPPILAFAVISQYTAAAMLVLMLLWGDRSGAALLDHAPRIIVLVLLSSLIGIGLGHTLYYVSIARLGVAVSAGVIQLQPIIVSMASVAWLGEALSPGQWASGAAAVAGAGVILVAQATAARPARSRAERAPPTEAAAAGKGAVFRREG